MGKVNNIPEGLKIFNTLTRDKAELTENEIGLYLCGPTVYDVSHIGHARSAYVFDVIVRYMRHKGKKVTLVRNVTDIDDKIINKAQSEIKNSAPGDTADVSQKSREVAERYLGSYHEDLDALGVVPPDFEPKATETIPDMIAFIELLIKKGYAYASDGSVYFDVRKFPEYGRLSGQSLDQMEEGARVALDKSKKDPLDFALWKASKENEPAWPSPWGSGRPGWHIECSVMSTKFLKNKFLIHGGGLDLVFPHHENEIAQTVCAGYKSAKYWLHNGLLTINSQKMSKYLVIMSHKGFRDKSGFDLLKLLFLPPYRHPVVYTEEKILEMKKKQREDRYIPH
jgi:cysteinyl-tRNA synthetase